jgi:hypothetical protein
MSTRVKGIVGAVLALIVAVFGWYVAYSDGDASTTPDTQAVISAGGDVINAVRSGDEGGTE